MSRVSGYISEIFVETNIDQMNKLQNALVLNALFSGVSGTASIVLNWQIAELFGTPNTTIFWIIGFVLIFFALTISYEIFKQRSLAVLWIIAQDILWVIGSILILAIDPFNILLYGKILIAVVAIIVFFMAVSQSRALAEMDSNPEKVGKRWRFERIVRADKKSVWELISDVGNYHMFAPNIDDVQIISGEGLGMVRTCSHGADTWAETCTLWSEETGYAYTVQTDVADYPYPFKFLNGLWEVEAIDNASTKIVMCFDFQYKHSIQNLVLHPFFRTRFFSIAEKLLDNWEVALKHKRQNQY